MGVKVEHIKTANQSQVIEYLQAANARLHPDLQIKKIAWSTRAIMEKKAFSTLHMKVATEGLLVDYEIKDCERFTKGCTMTQCFNCHKYGHIDRLCLNPAACGHCAGPILAPNTTWKQLVDIEIVLHAVKRGTKPGPHSAKPEKSKDAKQRGPCKNGFHSTSSRVKHQPDPKQFKQQKEEDRTPLRYLPGSLKNTINLGRHGHHEPRKHDKGPCKINCR